MSKEKIIQKILKEMKMIEVSKEGQEKAEKYLLKNLPEKDFSYSELYSWTEKAFEEIEIQP